MVGVLADAEGARPAGRYEDAEHVAADGGQSAVVKDDAPPLQLSALEQLGGTGCPAVLVGAVAPDVADDEHGDGDVRQGHPDQEMRRAHTRTSVGMTSGGAKGSSPTCSSGRPLGDQSPDRIGLAEAEPGQLRTDGIEHVEERPLVGAQGQPQKLEPDPVLLQDAPP